MNGANRADGAGGRRVLDWHEGWRLFRFLLHIFPRLLPAIILLILVNAVVVSIPAVFMQKVVGILEQAWQEKLTWLQVKPQVFRYVTILLGLYVVSLAANVAYNQLLAFFTQGSLAQIRQRLFAHMETLPVSFFDKHKRGELMSTYTNDVEALRQLLSQAFPQLCVTVLSLGTLLVIMAYYSLWMSLVVVGGCLWSALITRSIGGRSARFFMEQQHTLAQCEGFMEESIQGGKVIKVFQHEPLTRQEFDRENQALYEASYAANRYSNTLMPILNNVGYLIYILVACAGSLFLEWQVTNVSLSGMSFSLSVIVPFLGMSRQFSASIQQISPQINAIVMALAGAKRMFALLGEQPEIDEGTVRLVCEAADRRNCRWLWHGDGAGDRPLQGHVEFHQVEFAYDPQKPILHDITLTAEPGQKIALVGATGAGKTTITNLLNRFYEITEGSITYDGIPLQHIRKSALRQSLGIVLQDTVLFTGTVLDNIRYGRLDATEEECRQAAVLAGADDFIRHLPQGYHTVLHGAGSSLSQGQCQLLAIARAAVANPPVLIMDEATSSIDTRTEQIVQRGMDALMEGRTVFVIAHRLTTIRNADQILVMDQGRIVEQGSHEALMARRGRYYGLYSRLDGDADKA